jgi:hypothetical protein
MAVERSSEEGEEDMEDFMDEFSPRSKSRSIYLDENMYIGNNSDQVPLFSTPSGGSSSWTSSTLWLLQHTLLTSKDIAVSIYHGSTSVLYSSQQTTEPSKKKDQ